MSRGGLTRLSKLWTPNHYTGTNISTEDGLGKLVRAGFIRSSQSGIFHMLPLGLRVQDKIESLMARFMEEELGASRVSLPTLSPVKLWRKSGRFTGPTISFEQTNHPEFFSVWDRKNQHSLLAPTQEEEITWLVHSMAQSHKDFPLKLYQITRKFRDELRPGHGLLRAREFTMKDLYTFDLSRTAAKATYHRVRRVYIQMFRKLGLPVVAVEASSRSGMGGDLSHEYQLPSALGEDEICGCDSCNYAANSEVAKTVSGEGRVRDGDHCPECATGTLQMKKAVELGHAFYLGTRYSKPLGATASMTYGQARSFGAEVDDTGQADDAPAAAPLQMGCHGMGVSRIMGAMAEHFASPSGLNWPVVVAPYTCVIVPHSLAHYKEVPRVYGRLAESHMFHNTTLDLVVDDRVGTLTLPQRLNDAELIGIPIMIVMGRDFLTDSMLEVQCRRLGVVESVPISNFQHRVAQLIRRL